MLASIITAILLTSTIVLAAPQATSTASLAPNCKGTYGPFHLIAKTSSDVIYAVKLLVDDVVRTNATSHMVVDIAKDCIGCNDQPSFWNLEDNQLVAGNSSAPLGFKTVNQDVTSGSDLEFITSRQSQPAYPIYCAQTTGVDTPPILSVHDDALSFSICAFTSVDPPPTIYSIVYKRSDIQPAGVKCTPVKLLANFITT